MLASGSGEPRGAPAAPVCLRQSPDPCAPRIGAGTAREGPVSLQLELLRPALWQEAGCAGSSGLSAGLQVDCSPPHQQRPRQGASRLVQ